MNLLSWYQSRLRYPSMAALSELRFNLYEKCLCVAAEGFYIYIFRFRILMYRIRVSEAHIDMLQLVHDSGCEIDGTLSGGIDNIAVAAAGRGHVHVLQWLQAHGCKIVDDRVFSRAASGGHLEVLKWALAKGFAINDQ